MEPPALPELQSAAILPMSSVHATAALIAFGFLHPWESAAQIRGVLASLAELGGNAIHRSSLMISLEQQVSRRSSELSTLYDISIVINAPVVLDLKLRTTMEKTLAAVDADCGALYSYEASEHRLRMELQVNLDPEVAAGAAELTLRPELQNWLETSKIPWLASRGDRQTTPMQVPGASNYHTIINLPVRYEDQTLGLMTVLWKNPVDLSAEAIAFLIAVTARIGSALVNDDLRRKAEDALILEERQRLARRAARTRSLSHCSARCCWPRPPGICWRTTTGRV